MRPVALESSPPVSLPHTVPRWTGLVLGLVVLLCPWSLHAQVLPDLPETKPPAEAASAPAPATPPPTAPPEDEPVEESVTAQVGVRSLVYLQDPYGRDELGDSGATGETEVVLSGQIHRFLKWQAGFIGVLADTASPSAHLLDLVAKLELAEALNLWLGRVPIPADRTSLSTVWTIAPWTLPGRNQR